MFRRTLAGIFAAASKTHHAQFDTGLAQVSSIEGCVVVSVGNIAMGGRGKSPLSCWCANWFTQQGYATALLLRGYKGKMESAGGLVSTGEGPVVSPAAAGDEAYAAAMLCPSVQVRVGKDRRSQGLAAKEAGASIIVLDDGFQHRRINRDVDIVSISPEDVAGEASFFPKGSLRESPAGLTRADLLVGYADDWAHRTDSPPVLFRHHPTGLLSSSFQRLPLSQAPHKVHVLCGIEVPQRFMQTVRAAGISVTSSTFFRDHHPYSAADIKRVTADATTNGAEAVLTTTKDLTRMPHGSLGMPVFALHTNLQITRGESHLVHMLSTLSHPYRLVSENDHFQK